MEYWKKQKLKKFVKAKWYWFLTTGIFLIVTAVITLVGFSITGWSIVEWLHSKWAVTTLVSVIFLVVFLTVLYINWRRAKIFME